MKHCEDCGCKVYNGACTNCHETVYIQDQYIDQGIPLPGPDTQFMKEVAEQTADINKTKLKP